MVWIGGIIVLMLMFAIPSESVRQQAGDFYFVRTLGLVTAALVMMITGALLAFTTWDEVIE